jgi:ABC-type branched-subunit amino acid transport system substrate-binding protein
MVPDIGTCHKDYEKDLGTFSYIEVTTEETSMNKHAICRSLIAIATIALMAKAHTKDIIVGQSIAATGAMASAGIPLRLGAQVCFDMVNASGGINGQKIRFISKDDNYKVEETLRIVKELIDKDEAVVIVGESGTANYEALLNEKVLEKGNIAVVGPRTGATSLRQPFNPYLFHIRASYAQEVDKAIEYYSTIGLKKIGIVYQNDAFGEDGLTAAKVALKRIGLEPAFLATYERNSTKVEPAVKEALAASPQAILLLTTIAPTGAFVKLFREAGGTAQLLTLSVNDPNTIIKAIGIKNASGLIITTVFPSPSRNDYPIIKEYQTALKKFGPADAQPTLSSLEGYLTAKVIVEALKKAGANPTREKIMQSLETFANTDLGGFRVNFGPKVRSGSNYVDISIISRSGQVLR